MPSIVTTRARDGAAPASTPSSTAGPNSFNSRLSLLARGGARQAAVPGAELALHQHRIDPATELEPHRAQGPDHAEPEPLVQRDRRDVRAVADHRDHLAPRGGSAGLAARDQRREQRSADAAAVAA